MRPSRGEIHQGVNPIPKDKERRGNSHGSSRAIQYTMSHKLKTVALTLRPPATCQGPGGTHENICRTPGDIRKR